MIRPAAGTTGPSQPLITPLCRTGGPTWAAGKIGGALNFDGCEDLVQVPYRTSWNVSHTHYTVAFWAKVKTLPQDYQAAIAVRNSDTDAVSLVVEIDGSEGGNNRWNYGIMTTGPNICLGISCPPLSDDCR